MVWVKFHDELRRGAKRGLPRAVRFAFLELCLESRPGRGTMELPTGMSDLDALHDVLGGARKEVEQALKLLTDPPKPTEHAPSPRAMVELHGEVGARQLVIPSWSRWNSGQEAPGASTERSRRHRSGNGQETAPEQDGDDDATVMQRPLHDMATLGKRASNGTATAPRGEESKKRSDQIPDGPPPTPPPAAGGASGGRRQRGERKVAPEKLAKTGYATGYAEGISSVTGQPCTAPAGSKLGAIAKTHAKRPDGTTIEGEALVPWFRDTAADYCRARRGAKRDLEAGFPVHLFEVWLNTGRPAGPSVPEPRTTPAVPSGDVDKFRGYWLEQYKAAPFGYGDYVESESESSREAYGQLLAFAERQSAADGKPGGGKRWAWHWVVNYLADADRFFAEKRHAFSGLLWVAKDQPARWGKPGAKAPPAANTGARSPAPNFRPAGTLQPEGGWTPHKPAIDVRAVAEQVQAELDAEAAAAANSDSEGKAA